MSDRGTDAREDLASALALKVKLWVAVVFMVLSFAGGFIVRGLSQPPQSTVQGPVQVAPALSQQQLQGPLPAGHPGVLGSPTPQGTKSPAGGKASQGSP